MKLHLNKELSTRPPTKGPAAAICGTPSCVVSGCGSIRTAEGRLYSPTVPAATSSSFFLGRFGELAPLQQTRAEEIELLGKIRKGEDSATPRLGDLTAPTMKILADRHIKEQGAICTLEPPKGGEDVPRFDRVTQQEDMEQARNPRDATVALRGTSITCWVPCCQLHLPLKSNYTHPAPSHGKSGRDRQRRGGTLRWRRPCSKGVVLNRIYYARTRLHHNRTPIC